MQITFDVPGRPVRWQRPIEGERANGTFYRYNDPDAEAAKLAIAKAAKAAFIGHRPATGPVLVRVIAVFAIPVSWPPRVQSAARDGRVMHIQDPDLDQIVKLVKDALRGIAYVDDNQVCGYPNSAKRYGYPERTEITVATVPQRDDEITPGQRRLEKRVAVDGWDAVLAPPPRRAKGSKAGKKPGPARAFRGFSRSAR